MKDILSRCLGLIISTTALLAQAPHPTVLRVKHGNQMLPVVRVKGDDPYVMMDGNETLIRSTPVYFLERADEYSDNFVETPPGAMSGRMAMQVLGGHGTGGGVINGSISINITMKARKTIRHGFLTFAMLSFLGRDIIVHELPDLPAGQEVPVKLEVHSLPSLPNPIVFSQIFDERGLEVPTSDMTLAWDYYSQRDRANWAKSVADYQNQHENMNHQAVPVYTPSPSLGPDIETPKGDIVATLSVSADGTVSQVDVGPIEDESARSSVSQTLSGWLFLPKLKSGRPVPTKIKVPLQF